MKALDFEKYRARFEELLYDGATAKNIRLEFGVSECTIRNWKQKKYKSFSFGDDRFKKIIDVQTLQIWTSCSDCARSLSCSIANVSIAILNGRPCKGRRLEYLDYWLDLEDEDKTSLFRDKRVAFYTFQKKN